MMRQMIHALFPLAGIGVQREAAIWDGLETEIEEAIKIVRPYTMLPAVRLASLYRQVVFCERHEITGCFVECGVWKGGAVALMALANLKHGHHRRDLHLFDAFQDICEPDEAVDGAVAVRETRKYSKGRMTGRLTPLRGFYDRFGGAGSVSQNRELLERRVGYDAAYLHYHQGWFQETLPRGASDVGEIAILRLDSDWYASTKVCLNSLGPKVVRGGFFIVDDFGTYEGCRRAVEEWIATANARVFLVPTDSSCWFWMNV